MNIFNRRELTITSSLETFNKITSKLSQNKIDYTYSTIDRQSSSPFGDSSRARTGSYGQDRSAMVEYKIYVNKNDLDRAIAVMDKD